MGELLATVLSGGATGIIGSVFGGIFKWLDRREEAKESAAKRTHELALQDLQIKAHSAETEQELLIIQSESDQKRVLASYDLGKGVSTSLWAGNVKSMVRPTLTFTLILLTACIYFTLEVDAVVDGFALKAYIINTIVYTTSAAVLWWFGDRAREMKK